MKTEAGLVKKSILMGLLAFTLLIPNGAVAEPYFNKFVVFGTSLSDPGNIFADTHEVNVPPGYNLGDFLVPNAAYAIGGHHMTNGATWIEQLATPIGMKASVLPAFRDNNPKAMNYATDGTRAVSAIFPDKKLFSEQVDDFLKDVGFDPVENPYPAPPEALYVIEIGSNDLRDVLFISLQGDLVLAQQVFQSALEQIAYNLQRLREAGAQNFLIVYAPPIGFTPALRAFGPGVTAIANATANDFNGYLAGIAYGLGLSGADVTEFDLFGLTSDAVETPADFGLTDVENACITPFNAPWKCENPDEYLFWDVVHPTKAGHSIIAEGAANALGLN